MTRIARSWLLVAALVAPNALAQTGTLEMTVRYHGGEPAVGVHLRAEQRALASAHAFPSFAVSDEHGVARFHRVPTGKYTIEGDRSAFAFVEVGAETTMQLVIVLDFGVEVTGSVVDSQRQPVASAQIWLLERNSDRTGALVATADVAGAFALRGVVPGSWLQARTAKFAPTRPVRVESGKFEAVRVELVTSEPGATLRGRVLTPAGVPPARAAVCVMDPVLPQQSPGPWFACVTDAEGRFEIFGLPAGSLRIVALAPDLAPLDERIELTASAPTERELRLQPGCTVRGRVSDSRGEPEANAVVSYGDWSDFVCLKTRSAEDGSFELSGLPSGRAELIAQGVEQALELQPSSATTWNPTMRPPRHR